MSFRDVTGALGALIRLIGFADNLREVRSSLVMQKAEAEHARAEAGKLDRAPWTPLEPCDGRDPSEAAIAGLLAENPDWKRADAYREIARWNGEEVTWVNSIYQVVVRTTPGQTAHLAITRRDGLPVDSWEDMQRIKAELIGSECEAVELYPADSRAVERSNTRHLWASSVTGYRFPVGFAETPADARQSQAAD